GLCLWWQERLLAALPLPCLRQFRHCPLPFLLDRQFWMGRSINPYCLCPSRPPGLVLDLAPDPGLVPDLGLGLVLVLGLDLDLDLVLDPDLALGLVLVSGYGPYSHLRLLFFLHYRMIGRLHRNCRRHLFPQMICRFQILLDFLVLIVHG